MRSAKNKVRIWRKGSCSRRTQWNGNRHIIMASPFLPLFCFGMDVAIDAFVETDSIVLYPKKLRQSQICVHITTPQCCISLNAASWSHTQKLWRSHASIIIALTHHDPSVSCNTIIVKSNRDSFGIMKLAVEYQSEIGSRQNWPAMQIVTICYE